MSHPSGKSLRLLLAGASVLLLGQFFAPGNAAAVDPQTVAVTAATKAPPLRPNLVVLPADGIYVQGSGGERKIRFESALGNVGRGPVEVRPNNSRPCPAGKRHASQVMYRDMDGSGRYRREIDTGLARRSAGCMVFHRFHDHWHFEAASRYTLHRADEPEALVVARRKMSFCLRDSRRVPSSYGTFRYAEHYGACSRTSPQGISIGWADVYQSDLAGQALLLPPGMGDGLYCLRVKVDPRDQLLETRDNNNSSLRAFYLRGDTIRYRDSATCRSAG